MDSCIDHRFDGENVSRLHKSYSFIVGVVGDIGGNMEKTAYSMATVCSIDGKSELNRQLPIFLNVLSNNISDLSVHSARFTDF